MTLSDKLFPPRPGLPADITTIDVLKTVALMLMIVDHVGWLLMPDIEWFRVFGRLCVPIWFFLIGFARSRDVPTRWLVAGVIMLVANIAVGLEPLPLSVLFTMALTRVTIDAFWRFAYRHAIYFWWIVLLFIFTAYASNLFLEYGTMGFLLACMGYAVRNRGEVDGVFTETTRLSVPEVLMIVALASYGVLECMSFGFSMLGVMVVAAGLMATYFVLQTFESRVLPGTASRPSAPMYRFFGRYTLEIYVIHLLILKGVFGLQKLAIHIIG